MRISSAGCGLWYEHKGQGPPVLFIQGVGVCGSGWLPQVEALSASYDCIWYDNRGMGRSDTGEARITVDLLGDDALAVMDAAGWESAHLAGHSLGGLIALNVALRQPRRVRSLSLLCTFADGNEATRLTWGMMWTGMRTRLGSAASRRRAFLELLLTPDAHRQCDLDKLAAELAPLFGHDLGEQPPVAMKQLMAMKGYDVRPRLGDLQALPALVVSAKHDRIARPVAGRAIADGIAGARYVEVEDAAHGLPLTHAPLTNSLLLEHLGAAERR